MSDLVDHIFRNCGLDPADFVGPPLLPARELSACAAARQAAMIESLRAIQSTVNQMIPMIEFHPDRDDLFGTLDAELNQQLAAAGDALITFRVLRDVEGEA